MTLITVGNSGGVVGRCDARCYNAEHPTCECVCGGVNHGVGRAQAIANVPQIADGWGRMTMATWDGRWESGQGSLALG